VVVQRDDGDPVPLADSLDGVLRSLRAGAGRREVGGVFGRWEETVGAAIAANVRPVRLESRRLLVEVSDPAWATQVHLLADELRARLAEVTGVEVEHVDVRVARRR
jgi:predicted nucleic acid-binding Zn ribbon protein